MGVVVVVWQAARIPFEGSVGVSIDHARDWLALERAVHLDVEASFIRLFHRAGLSGVASWVYFNIHLPVLFLFMASARRFAPERYPYLRATFVLAHVPALVAIGLYPLAPPRWLPELPFATAPDLKGTLLNATAAVVSMHVGYPIFIAAATIWLAPRSRLAWLSVAYPLLVIALVLGTGNHYVLDAVTGALAIGVGAAAARVLCPGTGNFRNGRVAAETSLRSSRAGGMDSMERASP